MTDMPFGDPPAVMSNSEPDTGTPDISVSAQGSAGPVAWRYKHWPNELWRYSSSPSFGTPYPYYEPLYNTPHEAQAEKLLTQIEERFPNWQSFRDLLDCIDVTLHQLRESGRSPAGCVTSETIAEWLESETSVFNCSALADAILQKFDVRPK